MHVNAPRGLGNPVYEASSTADNKNILSPSSTIDRNRSDSLYMTIPEQVQNGHPTARISTAQVEVPNACKAGAVAETASVGYVRVSNAQCKLVMPVVEAQPQKSAVATTAGRESSAEGAKVEVHAKLNEATSINLKDSDAVKTQKHRLQTGNMKADVIGVEQSGHPIPSAADAGTYSPDENYATISDVLGPDGEVMEDEDDPYCLVGPSSETHSVCSEVFRRPAQSGASGASGLADQFHSMYVLLGAKSLDDFNERGREQKLEVHRMKVGGASVAQGEGAGEPDGSVTLMTDNPCHDENASLLGSTLVGGHRDIDPFAAIPQRSASMAFPPLILVAPCDNQSMPAVGTSQPPVHHTSQPLPIITIHDSTPDMVMAPDAEHAQRRSDVWGQ